MIKNLKFMLALLLVGGFSSQTLLAQVDTESDMHDVTINIPEVAILDIEGGSTITLEPEAPTEAGEALSFVDIKNEDLWLNYSSIVSTSNPTNKISVAITTGDIPGGMVVKLLAGPYTGAGLGTKGTPGGELSLTTASQDLITGIGSCYTEDGATKGHQLTYTLELDGTNYGLLDFEESQTLTVTYTIAN